MGTDHRTVDDAMSDHLGVVPDLAIANDAVGSNAHPIAELHAPLENHIDIQEDITSMRNRSTNIQTGRVRNGHPGEHELTRTSPSICSLDFRQLHLVIHPENFDDV